MAEHERTIALPEADIRQRADGIVEYRLRLQGQIDQETARRLAAAGRHVTASPRPVLLGLDGVTGLTLAARQYLADSGDFRAVARALAVVAATPLGRILGQFLVAACAKANLSARLFAAEADALAWLQGLSPPVAAEAADEALWRRHDQPGEILDVLSGLAALDFGRRAIVTGHGGELDAIAAAANMAAEDLASALQSRDERSRAVQESATAKSQFLANMSHEIRTPLTALLGFADLLMEPGLTESDRLSYARIIHRNGEHLLSLINDILDLSKIDAGKLTLEMVDCDVPTLLKDVETLMAVRAKDRGIGFVVERATPIPALIRTDPTRLRQILLNLVGNAIKFTEVGSVRLVVHWDTTLVPGRLRFDVVDTGIGMTPEQLDRLFVAFEQADTSMTRRFGGTGLGLAISRALAEAMGGSITVTSVYNVGSTFTLTIVPEVAADATLLDAATGEPAAAETPAAGQTLAGRILLAEDGPDNQLLLSKVLRGRGLTVTIVENGQLAVEQALAAWRDGEPYDVILMDMQMPLLDGYSATAHLREMGYRGPILALTAHVMAGERERCYAAGCNDYLSKPIDRQALFVTLARHLGAAAPAETEAPAGPAAPAAESGPLYSSYADDEDMAELIAMFVQNLPHRMAEIKTAAGRAEPEALIRIAHQLKGAAGGYGFAPISEAAARLEQGLKGGSTHQTPALIEELLALCQRACLAYGGESAG